MNTIYQDDLEINVIEFIKKIILQWKLLLLLSVCGGVLLAGVKYFGDSIKADNAMETPVYSDYQELMSGMNNAEKDTVIKTYERIAREYAFDDYAEKSAKMNMNLLNSRRIELIYFLQSENINVSTSLVKQFIHSDEFAKVVADAMNLNSSENYVNELIDCEFITFCGDEVVEQEYEQGHVINGEDCSFTITVFLPEGTEETKVADAIKKAISNKNFYTNDAFSEVEVTFVSEREYSYTDLESMVDAIASMTTLTNEKSSIKAAIAAMSEQQKICESLMLKENGISEDYISIYFGDFMADSEDVSVSGGYSPSVKPSLKWFLAGIMITFAAYVLITMFLNFFKPKAGRLFGIGALSVVPSLGTMRKMGVKIGFLNNRLYRVEGDANDQANAIVSSINYYLSNSCTDCLTLLTFGELSEEAELLSQVWKSQHSNYARIIDIPIKKAEIIDLYDKLIDIKSDAIAIIQNDRISISDINRIYSLMTDKKIHIIGSVEVL